MVRAQQRIIYQPKAILFHIKKFKLALKFSQLALKTLFISFNGTEFVNQNLKGFQKAIKLNPLKILIVKY